MAEQTKVTTLEKVVIRFSGDSGDGMQLAGNIFSNVSATVGNDICTFPDYPADIRAPQGSLTGVSGFQVHIGAGQVYTPGDRCHVLVAMNPSALKTQIKFCKPQGLIITDSDSFEARDLEKAQFKTDNPFEELGVKQEVLEVPISSMCKDQHSVVRTCSHSDWFAGCSTATLPLLKKCCVRNSPRSPKLQKLILRY